MTLETVPVLATNLAGGPTTDGKGIVVEWTLSNSEIAKFAIPLVDLPTVICYMLGEAKRASERCSAEELTALAKPRQIWPSPLTSIALGPSSNAQHEILFLRIGHIELTFDIPSEILVALAQKIIRMAELAEPESAKHSSKPAHPSKS